MGARPYERTIPRPRFGKGPAPATTSRPSLAALRQPEALQGKGALTAKRTLEPEIEIATISAPGHKLRVVPISIDQDDVRGNLVSFDPTPADPELAPSDMFISLQLTLIAISRRSRRARTPG